MVMSKNLTIFFILTLRPIFSKRVNSLPPNPNLW